MPHDLRLHLLSALDTLLAFDPSYDGVSWNWTQSPNRVRTVVANRAETFLLDDRVTLATKDRKPLVRLAEARSLVHLGGPKLSRRKEDESWRRLKEDSAAAKPIIEALPPLPPPVRPLPDLRLERFDGDYVENPAPPRERKRITERFWEVHGWLRIVTGWHGVVGPDDEPLAGARADFWLVEDQYNDDRYHHMEAYAPTAATPSWIADIIRVLRTYPGWAVSLSNARLLIFADRLLIPADAYPSALTASDVLAALPATIEASNAAAEAEEE